MHGTHRRFTTYKRGPQGIGALSPILLLLLLATGTPAQELACPDCHNSGGIPTPHDSGCRDTGCSPTCHAIDLSKLNHLSGPGTPVTGDRDTTCNTCHNAPFDGVYHPFRINVIPSTPTSPGVVDLDQSCGQCHGGGTAQDAQHTPRPPALYRTKAQLAAVARGMHDSAGVVYPATFSATISGLTVNVSATVDCGGSCPALTYDWDWGDGGQDLGSLATKSHTYSTAGTYSINLTVRQSGLKAGSVSRNVTVTAPDLPPTAAGTCAWDTNTWTMTVQDASTDTDVSAVQTIVVDWGDGGKSFHTYTSAGTTGAVLNHTYVKPGSYAISLKAIDSALQASGVLTLPCTATPAYFTIGGTVYKHDGTTPVSSASVAVRNQTTGAFLKTVYTASNGTFQTTGFKPGTYTLTITKSGYNFGVAPQATVTVGPSRSGVSITAVTP